MAVSMVVSNKKKKLSRKYKDDHVSNLSDFSVYGFDFETVLKTVLDVTGKTCIHFSVTVI